MFSEDKSNGHSSLQIKTCQEGASCKRTLEKAAYFCKCSMVNFKRSEGKNRKKQSFNFPIQPLASIRPLGSQQAPNIAWPELKERISQVNWPCRNSSA